MKQISRAEFRRRLPVGTKVEVTHRFGAMKYGPYRVVLKNTASMLVFETENGTPSYLHFSPGEKYFESDEGVHVMPPEDDKVLLTYKERPKEVPYDSTGEADA